MLGSGQLVHLHPSSVLVGKKPDYVVFDELVRTTRTYARGVAVIEGSWLPELAQLPTPDLHAPAQAGALSLAAAGVKLGSTYPAPMLDHGAARLAALARLKRARA